MRSPYLSTWLNAGSDGGNGGYLAGRAASFWAGQETGWNGMIKVDGQDFIWMGAPDVSVPLVTQKAFSYTSTRSIFTVDVNHTIEMVIEFLSPVSPKSKRLQSLPVSYPSVKVSSLDGKSHSVQLYTDVAAGWASGDRAATIQWEYGIAKDFGFGSSKRRRQNSVSQPITFAIPKLRRNARSIEKGAVSSYRTYGAQTSYTGWTTAVAHPETTTSTSAPPEYPSVAVNIPAASNTPPNQKPRGVAFHKFFRQQQLVFSEFNNQAEWGNWYYATDNTKHLTHQSGIAGEVRNQFIQKGFLANSADKNYRSADTNTPVFAFATDLGTRKVGRPVNTTYSINLVQEEVIQFLGANGTQRLPALWKDYFSDELTAVRMSYNDFRTQAVKCKALDNKIASDSKAVAGQDYLTVTSLAVRQAFGALQYAGTAAQPYLFLKEISSSGNIQTVDVMFPWHPIAIYLNPKLLKYALDPLFIDQESGNWPNAFAVHDIGYHCKNFLSESSEAV